MLTSYSRPSHSKCTFLGGFLLLPPVKVSVRITQPSAEQLSEPHVREGISLLEAFTADA